MQASARSMRLRAIRAQARPMRAQVEFDPQDAAFEQREQRLYAQAVLTQDVSRFGEHGLSHVSSGAGTLRISATVQAW
ncbi:MAG: hypothetical protein U1F67_17080 [Rubrivivax sp.]